MEEQHEISRFELLPEGVLSHIISFTSPKDAIRSSTLSKIIKSAADSNDIWEHFLPMDYKDIISRASSNSTLTFSSKKQLYFHLCDSSILIDEAKLSFNLSKESGKKCYMLCSRMLEFIWGPNSRYWEWISLPQSRFAEVARLKVVWWLEMRAKIKVEMLSPNTNYASYLIFQLHEQSEDWSSHRAKTFTRLVSHDDDHKESARVEIGEIASMSTIIYLENPSDEHSLGRHRRWRRQVMPDGRYPQRRSDGWMEIELGKSFNSSEENLSSVEVMFWETNSTTKHGLTVEGVEFRVVE